jgi:transcriptional repressor NrdR
MVCPQCADRETQVIDSRDTHDGVRRRRECLSCKHRFTTYERIEQPHIIVIKKSGDRERFAPEKIRRGVQTACKNRPVSAADIDQVVSNVEQGLYALHEPEVTSEQIGDLVRKELQKVDRIAYIRFVSVYQAFSNVDDFSQAIDRLPTS